MSSAKFVALALSLRLLGLSSRRSEHTKAHHDPNHPCQYPPQDTGKGGAKTPIMGSNSKNTKAHPHTMSATPHHQANCPTAMLTTPKAKTPTLPTNNPSTAASGLPSSPQSVSATPTKAATELSVPKTPEMSLRRAYKAAIANVAAMAPTRSALKNKLPPW